jgi:murein L,D-transpeptidase YcbB/YkuD
MHYDIALTTTLLRYAHDVSVGRFLPSKVYNDAKLPARTVPTGAALEHAVEHDDLADYIAAVAPKDDAYKALIAALAHYRDIADNGGWPTVTATSRAALIKRLAAEDSALSNDPSDDEVTAALKSYQTRNGLEPDGAVGPAVIASLNVPVATRIQQIQANVERRRWMPEKLERRYIAVNVPDQSLDFIRKGESVLHSKVIIGTPKTATPILRTEVEAVVANPPWDIPDFIAAKKLLPKLRQNPNYLQTRDIVLADGPADDPHGTKLNWHKITASTIPYQIQQPPGPDNALGTLMLDMPNDFDVYLHDTPDKQLFEADNREKSNGCVRVQEIARLASWVLADGEDDGKDKIDIAIATGKTQRLTLDSPMPVYLLYWTAIPQSDGTIGFRPDRYGRDRKLIAMMQAGDKPAPAAAPKKDTKPLKLSQAK